MLIINVLINEEVVSAAPEVSGSCEGGIPGHTVGVRQGIFPSSVPGSRFGADPRVPGRDQPKGRPQEMPKEVSRTAQSPHHPGRPQSCGARFRHHLGSMLKGLGSIPEHTNSFFIFSPQIIVMKRYTFILHQGRRQTLARGVC